MRHTRVVMVDGPNLYLEVQSLILIGLQKEILAWLELQVSLEIILERFILLSLSFFLVEITNTKVESYLFVGCRFAFERDYVGWFISNFQLLSKSRSGNWWLQWLITRAKWFLNRMLFKLSHIFREGKQIMDGLVILIILCNKIVFFCPLIS